MQTREEKLATWADPSTDQKQSIRFLGGSLSLDSKDANRPVNISEDEIPLDQLEGHLLSNDCDSAQDLWYFKAISFPRLKPGRLSLSFSKKVFQQVQDSWNLHPRTIEVFLLNNGVFTTFHSSGRERTFLLCKVPNSRSIGFDCVSITHDSFRRTTYALYHHLEDEASIFETLLLTPDRCINPYFFVVALYYSHQQHLEKHRNAIDDVIQGIERKTGLGNPGRLIASKRRPSLDRYPALADPKTMNQHLSYCQTDVAIIRHVARYCLDFGEWLVRVIDEAPLIEQPPYYQQFLEYPKTVRLAIHQDVEYMRTRTMTLMSQVQQIKERVQSQTNYMLSAIAQSDAEYTAAIAVDGKHDGTAMKTVAILGIVFLPGTFVATLFSLDIFRWGDNDQRKTSSLTVLPTIWIYWAVTVPLTVVTFLVWALWSRRENLKSNKRFAICRENTRLESTTFALMRNSPSV